MGEMTGTQQCASQRLPHRGATHCEVAEPMFNERRLYMEEAKTDVPRVGAFSGGGHPKDKGQCRNWEMTSTQGIDKLANTLGYTKTSLRGWNYDYGKRDSSSSSWFQ